MTNFSPGSIKRCISIFGLVCSFLFHRGAPGRCPETYHSERKSVILLSSVWFGKTLLLGEGTSKRPAGENQFKAWSATAGRAYPGSGPNLKCDLAVRQGQKLQTAAKSEQQTIGGARVDECKPRHILAWGGASMESSPCYISPDTYLKSSSLSLPQGFRIAGG